MLALVDPLVAGVGAMLVPLLGAPGVLKILHSASEDLEVLGHALGQIPEPLFDTQIAAVLCGYDLPPSSQKLVQAELGIALDKHATRTDWLSDHSMPNSCVMPPKTSSTCILCMHA